MLAAVRGSHAQIGRSARGSGLDRWRATYLGRALFKFTQFTAKQYFAWQAETWVVAQALKDEAGAVLPGQVVKGLNFSYSWLPGTINCYKWTLVAFVSALSISRLPI